MKKYWWAIAIGINLLIAVGIVVLIDKAQHKTQPSILAVPITPTASASPSPTPTDPAFESIYNIRVHVSTDHWYSWALVDNKSGIMVGSENWGEPNYLMSMIKPWIAADWLSRHPNPSATPISRLSAMIVDSENSAASDYFGGQESWDRLIKTCGLTELATRSWSWSTTGMSARDAARYGYCIYTGRVANPEWTAWIIDKMRHVRGIGDFGPRALFPDRTTIATKNGWEPFEGTWYVNCLSITDQWTISTLQRWPNTGEGYQAAIKSAEQVCNSVASQVLKLEAQ